MLHSSNEAGELSLCSKHDDSTINIVLVIIIIIIIIIIEGAKMAATGVAAPSRGTQRKPLGEVNRLDCRHQGNAKEPVRAKPTLASSKTPVGTKHQSYSQSSHRPRSQPNDKEHLKTKVGPAGREQVCTKLF